MAEHSVADVVEQCRGQDMAGLLVLELMPF
jgi:hypothetical protein